MKELSLPIYLLIVGCLISDIRHKAVNKEKKKKRTGKKNVFIHGYFTYVYVYVHFQISVGIMSRFSNQIIAKKEKKSCVLFVWFFFLFDE